MDRFGVVELGNNVKEEEEMGKNKPRYLIQVYS